MTIAYLDAIRTAGAGLIKGIALFDTNGIEVASASYARQPVTWDESAAGIARPDTDLVFNMTAGDVVASWHAMSDLTGGTDYGAAPLADANGNPFTYGNDGTFTLLAASTDINHAS